MFRLVKQISAEEPLTSASFAADGVNIAVGTTSGEIIYSQLSDLITLSSCIYVYGQSIIKDGMPFWTV
jgi:hypothetical protein